MPSSEDAERFHEHITDAWNYAIVCYSADRTKKVMWDFVRSLKSERAFRRLAAAQALALVEQWQANTGDGWTELPTVASEEDGRIEFWHLWETVNFGLNENPIEAAASEAELKPFTFVLKGLKTDTYGK